MSQHPSLRSDRVGGHYRNVLKRWEKIRHLLEKDKWTEEKDSVFHLQKIKRIKMKIKKRKPTKEEEKVSKETAPEVEKEGKVEQEKAKKQKEK